MEIEQFVRHKIEKTENKNYLIMFIKKQISFVVLLLLSARCISVSTTVTGEDATCEPGEGDEVGKIFTTGLASQCRGLSKITTEAECELAAEYNSKNNIDDNTGFVGGPVSWSHIPPGCFYQSGSNAYMWNKATSTKECSTGYKCICKTKTCIKCPINTYSEGGTNTICTPCKPPNKVNEDQTKCIDPETRKMADKAIQEETSNRNDINAMKSILGQISKQFASSENFKNNISSRQPNKLQRMVATMQVRSDYNNMRKDRASQYQRHGEKACEHEVKVQNVHKKEERRMQIISAITLHGEIDENTCLSTNRDELISAFCNFRNDFDAILSKQKIDKDGKDLWPNICCASSGDTCEPKEGTNIARKDMVPFALAQGGKVTKASLYGEILDVLRAAGTSSHKQGGYLLQGMLNALDAIEGDQAKGLEEEIRHVFHKIHLCGPRVFNSPDKDAKKVCQLFHPYGQLLNSFLKKFKSLFNNEKLELLKAQGTSLLETLAKRLGKKKNSKTNVCRLTMDSETEVKKKKVEFCSLYQPFDTTDDRIINVAIFHISKDISTDENIIDALADNARFIAGDNCDRTSPMFNGNDFSLQNIDMGRKDKKKEWVLLAKLDTSKNVYLRHNTANCNDMYLPHTTTNFGIYVDENKCCEGKKSLALCQSCSSKNSPTPLFHHWQKDENLFYEMTITGNVFKLKLDGNPILVGTKYTFLRKKNTVKPKIGSGKKLMDAMKEYIDNKNDNNNNNEEQRRRRLLDLGYDYSAIWNKFTMDVDTVKGTCSSEILKDVKVKSDGSFSFQCSKAKALCACIEHVGESGKTQEFVGGSSNIFLNLFLSDGIVGYEIQGKNSEIEYGAVNDGKMDRRRRRLLRARDSGAPC